ncbi:hypothetical protein C7974DRAFT_458375 [Boeremia exigua]|uniref:uncharacterized protein n=1 Tax=Boeremia exigua TaxID=749465 RepID=UPI001E8CC050|nr:uncharacterized protein C7974DRAFT_458375 [Boeremia exigua]KAH6620306.1 hypothetical protein C7974DRAFT_458375 [Boeremia exigua]
MAHTIKATNGIATQAKGALITCDSGSDGFELSYSCQGPACSSLNGNFLDITCHADGSSRLICSNDFKCQSGTPSYQSNFTFNQIEVDPWSPAMKNEPDTWVIQDQDVLVGGCAKFSLTSDGTKHGTLVDDDSQTNLCPNVKGLSRVSTHNEPKSTSFHRPHASATQRPLVFGGTGARCAISKMSLLLMFTLVFLTLTSGVYTSATHSRHERLIRATSDKARAFAEGFGAELAQKASDQGINGEAFASKIVADVISSICQSYFEGSVPGQFTPEVLKNCVSSIYSNHPLPRPGVQFFAIFGASLLCDYIVSEAYPGGQNFLPDGCKGLQDLTTEVAITGPVSTQSASATPFLLNTHVEVLHTIPFVPSFSTTRASERAFSTKPQADTSSSQQASVSYTSTISLPLLQATSLRQDSPDPEAKISSIHDMTESTFNQSTMLPVDKSSATLLTFTESASAISLLELPLNPILPKVSSPTLTYVDTRIERTGTLKPTMVRSISMVSTVSVMPSPTPSPAQSKLTQSTLGLSESLVTTKKETSSLTDTSRGGYPVTLLSNIVVLTTSSKVSSAKIAAATTEIDQVPATTVQTNLRLETSRPPNYISPDGFAANEVLSKTQMMDALSSTFSSVIGRPWSANSASPSGLTANLWSLPSSAALSTAVLHTMMQGDSESRAKNALGIMLESVNPSRDSLSFDSAETPINMQIVTDSSSAWKPETSASAAMIHLDLSTAPLQTSAQSSLVTQDLSFVDLVNTSTSRYADLRTSLLQSTLLSGTSQSDSASPKLGASQYKLGGNSDLQMSYVSDDRLTFFPSPNLAETSFLGSFITHLDGPVTSSSTPPLFNLTSAPTGTTTGPFLVTSNLTSPSSHKRKHSMSFMTGNSVSNSIPPMTPLTLYAASVLGSMSPPTSRKTIEPMITPFPTAEGSALIKIPASTIYLVSILTYPFAHSGDKTSFFSCSRYPEMLAFCPGSGCVSLTTDKAHCGACNEICEHECHNGVCICPDLTKLHGNNECANEPGSVVCSTGYTRNMFKVCIPFRATISPRLSSPKWTHPATITETVAPFATLVSTKPIPVLVMTVSTEYPVLGSIHCPPGRPDICIGGCFNTKTEHNHCGGCGNFCSGTCVDERCLASPTRPRPQLASPERMGSTTDILTETPMGPLPTSTGQPVASYIWKGLAGSQ